MTELLSGLIIWIVANSAYSDPNAMPTIRYQSETFFTEQVCQNSDTHCAFRAYYQDGSNMIVLHEAYAETLDDARARSLLVHELVHYLQDTSGQWGAEKTCHSWLEREHEALRLQYLYLVKQTGNYHLYYPPPAKRNAHPL